MLVSDMTSAVHGLPSRIGRFQILDRLATGGMAEVFLAKIAGSRPDAPRVVVKQILPHLARNEQMRKMFLQEARIAARLNHPNVVRLIELGEENDQLYLAMDYVPGVTLREAFIVARDQGVRFPVEVVVDLMSQACEGVHAAHELADPSGRPAGLVHRDLSPHNLMVDARGHLTVLDFGIAKISEDVDHTRTGILKGKLRYMSPEQCAQGPLDRRSDVFTLGIVAWELLAGERLFDLPSDLATMHAITTGKVRSIDEVRPGVPPGIAAAVHDALAVDPDGRMRGADALRRALLAAAEDADLRPSIERTAAFLRSLLGARIPTSAPAVDEGTMAAVGAPPAAAPPLFALVLGVALVLASIGAAGIATMAFLGRPRAPVLAGPPVRIALAPILDVARMAHEFDALDPWLEARLGRPVSFEPAATYEAAAEALLDRQAEFAILTPYLYVLTANRAPIGLVARELVDGSTGTDGVIVVPETSRVDRPGDLVGKRLCVSDTRSATGYLLPRRWLREGGVNPDKDLTIVASGNHHAALRALVDGQCDAAGTYAGALLTADEAKIPVARLRTVAVTGRTPHECVVSAPTADPALVAKLRDALLAVSPPRDLGVPRIGASMRITRFVLAKPEDFTDIRTAAQAEVR